MRGESPKNAPGKIIYLADPNGAGFKPAYQLNAPLDQFSAAIERRQQAVRAAFYADLFLMATQLQDVRSATEIAERREEKLVMLGPVLERLHDDLLEPLIGRVFQIMARNGHIPPAAVADAGRAPVAAGVREPDGLPPGGGLT